ncbi:lytic transglycosylase domain-containing protein [Palleronia caenipelagi]|uniref:Lytic transglycosylase domain-containing protein n=1 Tax=Palleronia caenipelagi TaxID=2489174 RepID=A0A547PXZ6_9RHOB|nr:lytic transglycosylase domain-containing protein [Palleronia caenipelagi]TRD19027.1 lytic transglycosylase domain-containing protein [Palleronia caenipelagi]
MRVLIAFFLCMLTTAGQAEEEPTPTPADLVLASIPAAAQIPRTRPLPRPAQQRCTTDGTHCIHLKSYTDDVCTVIERAADHHGIDSGFLARLLWQESFFDAAAVSPVGAQGIAQFMPGTAELRGLEDPFNPAEAIMASADYLAELISEFGNEGLAAAAYNSGEGRAADFVRWGRILPGETRSYVNRITGFSAMDWLDGRPPDVDFALAKGSPFQEACRKQAATRSVNAFKPSVSPWGVVVAAGRRRATVQRFVGQIRQKHGGIIGGREIQIVDGRLGNARLSRLTARIAVDSRDEALGLCRALQRASAFCKVSGP